MSRFRLFNFRSTKRVDSPSIDEDNEIVIEQNGRFFSLSTFEDDFKLFFLKNIRNVTNILIDNYIEKISDFVSSSANDQEELISLFSRLMENQKTSGYKLKSNSYNPKNPNSVQFMSVAFVEILFMYLYNENFLNDEKKAKQLIKIYMFKGSEMDFDGDDKQILLFKLFFRANFLTSEKDEVEIFNEIFAFICRKEQRTQVCPFFKSELRDYMIDSLWVQSKYFVKLARKKLKKDLKTHILYSTYHDQRALLALFYLNKLKEFKKGNLNN